MGRLFIGQREIDFFNDITKEIIKDIVGQFIIYWPVSALKTKIHPIYNEAVKKIFENPIKIEALVGQPTWESTIGAFGPEQQNKVEVYFQGRDLEQKNIVISEGDYFTYGEQAYEIVSCVDMSNYFGQIEHNIGFKAIGLLAKKGEFTPEKFYKPLNEQEQEHFEQQRGLKENSQGETGDIRDMRERLGDELGPIALDNKPIKVDVGIETSKKNTGFYDE